MHDELCVLPCLVAPCHVYFDRPTCLVVGVGGNFFGVNYLVKLVQSSYCLTPDEVV